jgi:uncharacterized protein with HEPN domain
MTRRSDSAFLDDMVGHASEACEFLRGRERSDLDRDRQLCLAIVRLLEVVGEAAAQVSPELRERHPEIAWRGLIGMRNRLIHAYQRVDLDIVWDVVTLELPEFIVAVRTIAEQECR